MQPKVSPKAFGKRNVQVAPVLSVEGSLAGSLPCETENRSFPRAVHHTSHLAAPQSISKSITKSISRPLLYSSWHHRARWRRAGLDHTNLAASRQVGGAEGRYLSDS